MDGKSEERGSVNSVPALPGQKFGRDRESVSAHVVERLHGFAERVVVGHGHPFMIIFRSAVSGLPRKCSRERGWDVLPSFFRPRFQR